jgi:hypothetical protein
MSAVALPHLKKSNFVSSSFCSTIITTASNPMTAESSTLSFPRRRRRRQQQEDAHPATEQTDAKEDGGDGSPLIISTPDKHVPRLRRAGSSTYSSFVSLASLDDQDDEILPKQDLDELRQLVQDDELVELTTEQTTTTSIGKTTASFCCEHHPLFQTIRHQLQGMTDDFCQSGLPWSGPQCRSPFAGGTGVLYSLPALCCQNNPLEQCTWILQAFLSVMADYVCIHDDSLFHGMDRFFATFNTVAMLWRAAWYLHPLMLLLAILPLSCFVQANRAKAAGDLSQWQWYHGWWHITGSVAVAVAVHGIYYCGGEESDSSLPWGVCQTAGLDNIMF